MVPGNLWDENIMTEDEVDLLKSYLKRNYVDHFDECTAFRKACEENTTLRRAWERYLDASAILKALVLTMEAK